MSFVEGFVWGACKRRDPRYRVSDGYLEVEHPDGCQRQLQVIEMCLHGISFGLDNDESAIQPGTTLPDVVLRHKDHTIRGTIAVTHSTSGLLSGTICGGSFHPASEADQESLEHLIDELKEPVGNDPS